MSENIIAKTNVGGDVWEVPITVSGDNRNLFAKRDASN